MGCGQTQIVPAAGSAIPLASPWVKGLVGIISLSGIYSLAADLCIRPWAWSRSRYSEGRQGDQPGDPISSGCSGNGWRGWRASRNTSLLQAEVLTGVLQAGEKHPLAAPGKVKFSDGFGRQPGADPFLMPAPWSTTPCSPPSCWSTYLTIINSPEAPAVCFVLGGMRLPKEQGVVWQLFLYWEMYLVMSTLVFPGRSL